MELELLESRCGRRHGESGAVAPMIRSVYYDYDLLSEQQKQEASEKIISVRSKPPSARVGELKRTDAEDRCWPRRSGRENERTRWEEKEVEVV